MRSLFLKIFLWFWAAMALVVIAFATVVANTQSRPSHSATVLNVKQPLWTLEEGASEGRGPHGNGNGRGNHGPPRDNDGGPPSGGPPDRGDPSDTGNPDGSDGPNGPPNENTPPNEGGPREGRSNTRGGARQGFPRDDDSPFVALQVAAELIKTGGLPSATPYLARLERTGNAQVHLFDGQGKALVSPPTGLPVGSPSNASAQEQLGTLVERALQTSQPEVTPSNRGDDDQEASSLLAAQRARSPQGALYVVALEWRTESGHNPGPPRGRGPLNMLAGFLLFADAKTQLLRLLAVLATTGLVCYLLARNLTSPISQLREATRRLAKGNLSTRVDSSLSARRDEMGVLGRDFDLMAERIETLVKAQSRLLADVSHELRSPLARLSMALELVRQTATPESKPDLDRIEREAERLNAMIGQLLTISRLESGQQQPDGTRLNVRQLVADVCADADYEARKHGAHVSTAALEEFTTTGTASLLRSAIENVVRNAVRYTDTGTSVEVSLTRETIPSPAPHYAVIRVRDHGPGVPEDALDNLFRPFYRVEGARDRQSGGEGLGLAITEAAAKLHGGKTVAYNAAEGGLVVEISLPINQDAM